MKTVSGKVISSKPISISKASRVLSTFISADTGASQAVSAYLGRASAAFIELTQLHKELKPSRSERKRKKRHLHRENPNETAESDPNTVSGREQSHRSSKGGVLDGEEENEKVSQKEKKKKKKNRDDFGKFGDNRGEIDAGESEVGSSNIMVIEEEKKKKGKKSVEAAEDDSEVRRSKKKKRRRSKGDD